MPDLAHLTVGQVATAIITIGAVAGVIGGWMKWLGPRWRRARAKWVAAVDSIVGREEIRDSITDEVKVPALPGIGVRMAHQEQQMELLTVTVTKLVDQQAHQQRLEQRVEDHESRLAKLEQAEVERIVTRAESAAAYRAIETAIKATPDVESDAVDADTDD